MVHGIALLSLNTWQLLSTRCSSGLAGPGEFTKPGYDSTFRKRAKGMRFVNSKQTPSRDLGKQDFAGSGEVQKAPRSFGFCPLP